MADFVDNLTGIINAAVICAELDDRHADRTFCFRFYGIFFGNEFADIFFVKAVFKNAADRTESVSRRFQIYRGGAGENKSTMVYRFVVISVEEDNIKTTLLEVDVPFSTKYVLSALYTRAACFCADRAGPS